MLFLFRQLAFVSQLLSEYFKHYCSQAISIMWLINYFQTRLLRIQLQDFLSNLSMEFPYSFIDIELHLFSLIPTTYTIIMGLCNQQVQIAMINRNFIMNNFNPLHLSDIVNWFINNIKEEFILHFSSCFNLKLVAIGTKTTIVATMSTMSTMSTITTIITNCKLSLGY